ncbi:hypothetical protein NM688_g7817 [Phlebia brevispora]|uniref:Uncharacterized protein n=1 Tax=Phlebia brevispora TaxID=194682 RepID=A0ACC1S0U0_9APHY|nr:hypothetical protein NM688_g7817 [Phlebia brevispora]
MLSDLFDTSRYRGSPTMNWTKRSQSIDAAASVERFPSLGLSTCIIPMLQLRIDMDECDPGSAHLAVYYSQLQIQKITKNSLEQDWAHHIESMTKIGLQIRTASETTEYDRLKVFFDILASRDRSRYALAATMFQLPLKSPRDELCPVPHGGPDVASDSMPRKKHSPIPTLDARNEFTFRMTIQELYTVKEFQKKIEDVLKESKERFLPLAELKTRRAATCLVSADKKDGLSDGSLRLKRPTKRRLVDRDKKPGADLETLEWFYETAETSMEYSPGALNLCIRDAVSDAKPNSPTYVNGTDGARMRLENDVLSPRKRRLTER